MDGRVVEDGVWRIKCTLRTVRHCCIPVQNDEEGATPKEGAAHYLRSPLTTMMTKQCVPVSTMLRPVLMLNPIPYLPHQLLRLRKTRHQQHGFCPRYRTGLCRALLDCPQVLSAPEECEAR